MSVGGIVPRPLRRGEQPQSHRAKHNEPADGEAKHLSQGVLQIMHLGLKSEIVGEFVMSKRLGRIAAELMGVTGVRVYHEQALYKESSGGIPPWHADQFYWPLSNENTCTVWIPLQETSMNMGPLGFTEKSHNMEIGRDLEIFDTSEKQLQDALAKASLRLNDTRQSPAMCSRSRSAKKGLVGLATSCSLSV